MNRGSHVSEDRLISFSLDEVDDAERGAIESHLADCASCKGTVEALSRAFDAYRVDPLPSAPSGVLVRLLEAQARLQAVTKNQAPRKDSTGVGGRSRFWPPLSFAAPGLVALCALFLAGFWVGKQSAIPTPGAGASKAVSEIKLPLPNPPEVYFQTVPAIQVGLHSDGEFASRPSTRRPDRQEGATDSL